MSPQGKSYDSGYICANEKILCSSNFHHASFNVGYVSEMARLSLVESYALPMLIYAFEALNLCSYKLRSLAVCWNSIFRKLFKFHRWESVKLVQLLCGRMNLSHMFYLRKIQSNPILFVTQCK